MRVHNSCACSAFANNHLKPEKGSKEMRLTHHETKIIALSSASLSAVN